MWSPLVPSSLCGGRFSIAGICAPTEQLTESIIYLPTSPLLFAKPLRKCCALGIEQDAHGLTGARRQDDRSGLDALFPAGCLVDEEDPIRFALLVERDLAGVRIGNDVEIAARQGAGADAQLSIGRSRGSRSRARSSVA